MISLPKEFLCTCYPEETSKHYQLPFFHFSTSYVTLHSQLHSSRVLNVMVFKEFKGKILLLRTFKDGKFFKEFKEFKDEWEACKGLFASMVCTSKYGH